MAGIAMLAAVALGCGRPAGDADTERPCCIDMLELLPAAEIRPSDRAPDAVQPIEVDVNGDRVPALSAAVPTRVTFTLRIPEDAAFTTQLGVRAPATNAPEAALAETAGVVFRLGIVDDRTYEQLLDTTVHAREAGAWTPVQIDLSAYAGWQWSLFYRPSEVVWHLVLNTYPLGAGSERLRGLWLAPRIAPLLTEAQPDAATRSALIRTGVRRPEIVRW